MKYIIMAAGDGKRWKNYMGIPKHLVKINGETLLERTTRLLKENNVNYAITGHDMRYTEYGDLLPQTYHDCEVDRFEQFSESLCYLYGDVYYSEDAIKTIIETPADDIMFFGSEEEIFAVKVNDLPLFYKYKNKVKNLYMQGKINRCIGWEVYRCLNGIPFDRHIITKRYTKILDETDDIDYPEDYEKFKEVREK